MYSIDISIIIVTWNVKIYVIDCLRSLVDNVKCNHEIIVVDNASMDGTAENIKHEFSNVTLIANNKNIGFAQGNNQGIKIARGRFILLLNPDTKVLGNAIDRIVELLHSHKDVSIAGGTILNPDGSLQPSLGLFPSLIRDFLFSCGLTKLFRNIQQKVRLKYKYNNIKNVITLNRRYCSGAFLIIRRELFEKIGLLDERYPLYFEETDFCYRALKSGYKIDYFPNVEIIHYGGQSTSQIGVDALNMHFKSLFMYYSKFFGSWRLICSRFAVFSGSLFRFFFYFPSSIKNYNSIIQHIDTCLNIAKTAYVGIKSDKKS